MVRFCDNEILKGFVSNSKINLDFGKLMNKKAIVIVRLASGIVPQTISNIIGTIINMRLNMAAKERLRVPATQRHPYFLIIDEFQNFVSTSSNFSYSQTTERDLTSILSEARKYGLGLVIANQYISQLDRGAREAIFGNVGSKIAFRVGSEDGGFLAQTFRRGMGQGDFADLPNYYGYASMLMNNVYVDPFTIKTIV
jgi:type IV secretory pathway TraG/TraD family ATPase VirD4